MVLNVKCVVPSGVNAPNDLEELRADGTITADEHAQ
jgi:hypothetical protein